MVALHHIKKRLTSTLRHINTVLLLLLALVYIMPNFNKTVLVVSDDIEQTSQDGFASDVEDKEFTDTEVNLPSNFAINNLSCNDVFLNYINNQVPIEPVIKQPTPPPQTA